MEEYIADLQEKLIKAQHRFMKMHRDMKKVHFPEQTQRENRDFLKWPTMAH